MVATALMQRVKKINWIIVGIAVLLLLSTQIACIKTPPEWPKVNVYTRNNSVIYTRVNKEFVIGLKGANPRLQRDWFPTIDQNMITQVDDSLLDAYGRPFDPQAPHRSTHWYLFKALKPGETEILFHEGVEGAPTYAVFKVIIK